MSDHSDPYDFSDKSNSFVDDTDNDGFQASPPPAHSKAFEFNKIERMKESMALLEVCDGLVDMCLTGQSVVTSSLRKFLLMFSVGYNESHVSPHYPYLDVAVFEHNGLKERASYMRSVFRGAQSALVDVRQPVITSAQDNSLLELQQDEEYYVTLMKCFPLLERIQKQMSNTYDHTSACKDYFEQYNDENAEMARMADEEDSETAEMALQERYKDLKTGKKVPQQMPNTPGSAPARTDSNKRQHTEIEDDNAFKTGEKAKKMRTNIFQTGDKAREESNDALKTFLGPPPIYIV